MNVPRARSVSSEKGCGVVIDTALRIRPLSRKERDDTIVLKTNGSEVALLNDGKAQDEYHFNHVLHESTSQDKIYNTLGLPIVTATMNSIRNSSSSRRPKSHLLISMGTENAGKTYTCFGGTTIQKRRAAQDGLVPRLLDTLFSQSNHAGSGSKGFAVQLSMMQVTQVKGGQSPQIHDLLASSSTSKNKIFGASPKKKKNLNVRNMAARFERAIPSPVSRKQQKASDSGGLLDVENLKPVIQTCNDVSEARETLQTSLSASQKTGSLYITIQPVVGGKQVGDKICILDMAGAGNENRAIIDCLQALKHNSNGKSVKPVSFRNHPVTMILNPLFLQSSFVNVTLLLAAYPGHADFNEKQTLFNDLETLHSVAPSATAANNSVNQQKISEVNDRDDRHASRNHDKSRHTLVSSFRQDELQNTYQQKDSRDPRPSLKGPPIATRMAKAKPLHSSRRDYPPTDTIDIPTATASVPKSKIRVSAYERSVASTAPTFDDVQRKAQPSAPTYDDVQSSYANLKQKDTSSSIFQKPKQRIVEPSAPALKEVQEKDVGYKKALAMDFPGLDMNVPDTRGKTGQRIYTEKNYSKSRKKAQDDRIVTSAEERDISRERRHGRTQQETKKEDLKSPLGRSSLENCDRSTSAKIGKSRGALPRTVDERFNSQENSFETDFGNFDHLMEEKSDELVKKLKEQLQRTTQEKNALEKMCSQLENENAQLRQLSRAAGRFASTQREEEEFEACRKLRREAQNKIKAPVQEHLDRVNNIYDIKNQWCMTNKTHFSLKYPDHFQRAPVLDVRDRQTEQQEELKKLCRKEILKNDETDTEKADLTNTRRSITPTRRPSPKKPRKSPPPTGLSALRRLVGTTLKN